jgi:hypothetical protein
MRVKQRNQFVNLDNVKYFFWDAQEWDMVENRKYYINFIMYQVVYGENDYVIDSWMTRFTFNNKIERDSFLDSLSDKLDPHEPD